MSVSTETLEKLKVQLKAQKDLGTPINGDLYSHLFEVFNRIILHHQKDGFDKFEDISAFVKYHNFKISDPDQDIDVNGQAAAPPSAAQLVAYLDKFRDLLAEKPDMVAPEDKGLVATEITCQSGDPNESCDCTPDENGLCTIDFGYAETMTETLAEALYPSETAIEIVYGDGLGS